MRVSAAAGIGLGAEDIFFIAVQRTIPPRLLRLEIRELAGEPALCYWWGGFLVGVTTVATAEDHITAVFTVRNPKKLALLQADTMV